MKVYPAGWYPLALSSEVAGTRPRKVRAFATDWCLFRTAEGRPAVVGTTCCHMGADLSVGRVAGERVRCALHAWEFGADGACGHIPGQAAIPPRARQVALPAVESYGLVWAFLGQGTPPEPPSVEGFTDPLLSRPYVATLALPYPMIGTNAFDTHHLPTLHHRSLDAAPEVTQVSPRRLRLRYSASVVGESLYDRITRALGVSRVEVEVECWDGTQLIFYHRSQGAFTVFGSQIVDDETTRVYLRTGRPRRWAAAFGPLDRLALRLHHRLILSFVFQDLEALRGIRFRPGVLLPDKDREFIAWHRYFTGVPRVPVPE